MTEIVELKAMNSYPRRRTGMCLEGMRLHNVDGHVATRLGQPVTYHCVKPHVDEKRSKPGKTVFAIYDHEWIRDAVLCEQHALELELKLIEIGSAFDAPTQENA